MPLQSPVAAEHSQQVSNQSPGGAGLHSQWPGAACGTQQHAPHQPFDAGVPPQFSNSADGAQQVAQQSPGGGGGHASWSAPTYGMQQVAPQTPIGDGAPSMFTNLAPDASHKGEFSSPVMAGLPAYWSAPTSGMQQQAVSQPPVGPEISSGWSATAAMAAQAIVPQPSCGAAAPVVGGDDGRQWRSDTLETPGPPLDSQFSPFSPSAFRGVVAPGGGSQNQAPLNGWAGSPGETFFEPRPRW